MTTAMMASHTVPAPYLERPSVPKTLHFYPPPARRLNDPFGQKQEEGDEADIEDDVFGIDDPALEILQVADDGQIAQDFCRRRASKGCRPADDPEKKEGPKGDRHGDDLVFGDRRGKHAHSDERGAEQKHAQVGRKNGSPVGRAVDIQG